MEKQLKEKTKKTKNDYKKKFKFYEKLRKKFPQKDIKDEKRLKDYLFLLPDLFFLTLRLTLDKRVDSTLKIIASALVAYVIMPIDLIPDFIPIIGYLDDLVIVSLGLNKILKDIPSEIIEENWSGKKNILEQIRGVLRISEKTFSKKTLKKIKAFVKDAVKGD